MVSPTTKFSSAHLKWIVIGVLGVTFMLVFKDELSSLLNRTDEITVGSDGIKIVTKTIDTPLGKTIVSGPPTFETAGITSQSLPDYQSPKGYLINWPQDGSWSSRPDFAQSINADLVISYNRAFADFAPNVNVTIEPSSGMSIRQWMEWSKPKLTSYGFTITNAVIDDVEGSAVRVVRGNFGMDADMIQRIIIDREIAYIVTALRPLNINADPKLWQDLNNIINSFRVAR